MSGAGGIMFIISLLGTIFAFKKVETKKRWLLHLMPWMILVVEVAAASGWIYAEMGRQPFLIFGIMPTSSGVSPIPASSVLFSLIVFCFLYTILGIAQFVLFRYTMNKQETTIGEVN